MIVGMTTAKVKIAAAMEKRASFMIGQNALLRLILVAIQTAAALFPQRKKRFAERRLHPVTWTRYARANLRDVPLTL